jgi:hypothetical protein
LLFRRKGESEMIGVERDYRGWPPGMRKKVLRSAES